jgi:hypothetical protein
MSTEKLIDAAARALEQAQNDRREAKAAEARARAIADQATRAAQKAESEAQYQLTGKDPTQPNRVKEKGFKSGTGPKYNKAKADAEKARKRADEARRKAITAASNAKSAADEALSAEKRMAKFNKQIEDKEAAAAYRTRTAIAIGAGLTATIGISGTQKILEGSAARSATNLLLKDLAKSPPNKTGIEASLRAIQKAGVGAEMTWRGLAGKAVVPLGAAAALISTSTYVKGEAKRFRENGQEDIAQGLETFALAERYAAVGLVAEGVVGTLYDAAKKVGKPTANVKQLQVIERAREVAGIAEPLTKPTLTGVAKAGAGAGNKVGGLKALTEAAKLVGATPSGRKTKATLAKAIAEKAARLVEPATKAAGATKAVGSLSPMAIRRSIRSVAGKAVLPLAVGVSVLAGMGRYNAAKASGKGEGKAVASGIAAFADDMLMGAPGAVSRQARMPSVVERRSKMLKALRQPGGYAKAARNARKATPRVKSDGIRDAYTTKDGVYVPAKIMTAKMRKPRRR